MNLHPFKAFANFFFFNATATTEIYTLSLHDALPICIRSTDLLICSGSELEIGWIPLLLTQSGNRSEEHTSELQSHVNLVCRLLLEKKKALRLPCTEHARRTRAVLHEAGVRVVRSDVG